MRAGAAAAAALLIAVATPAGAAGPAGDFSRAEPFEARSGGGTTSDVGGVGAFAQPAPALATERRLDFAVGGGIFRKLWVSAPASTRSSDGLGPLWNARSCASCHMRAGRGRPPAAGEPAISLLFRLSVPPDLPEPTYGRQLQPFAVQGHRGEGAPVVTYAETPVRLADGTHIRLRRPTYRVRDLAYGPLDPRAMISPRVAPPLIGLGLVEMIPEAAIAALADPDDRDGDGISGRMNRVADPAAGGSRLGRFGWKAGQPSLDGQLADAFALDMGLSTPAVPAPWGDCTMAQPACRAAPHGAAGSSPEVAPAMFDLLLLHVRHLAVPARRDVGAPEVLAGKRLFQTAGCAACHVPSFVTGDDPARPALSGQRIWPYSDFLLHDMGDGLADGRPEGSANGREWRTSPLWGIGLTEIVSGHAFLLHDGRARGLLEAILWHDGEAAAARRRVVAMSRADRAALLAFLRSL
ncbi:MAG: di-heme oxidoredictase family protein [Alphaproteobacteria bacterium]